jgi:NAD(P)-dependent dehydrogenase (short-subunit alcohol dehydrogenase family)
MGKLSGKVAVITGGNSGIGLATAKRFVEEGAQVVITGRRKKELEDAAAAIERNITAVGDVSRLQDLDRLYSAVREKHGRIDVLFANAGIGSASALGAITEEQFDDRIQHSAHIGPGRDGLFNLVKSLPPTLKYEPGTIVAEKDFVIVHGRFSGFGQLVNWIAADILRIKDGVLVEHWDVIQDEATKEQSKSGQPMFGDKFPTGEIGR